MSYTIKGILSFAHLFQPRQPANGGDPKFSGVLLLPPNDPQISTIWQAQETAKLNQWPSGNVPANADFCFSDYDTKFRGKDYYDSRFSGYWALSFSAKAEDRPVIVDHNRQQVIDPSTVFAGQIVYVHVGISAYAKGTGGVGSWINGVMTTPEICQFGRLDGRPSVDQMFQNVGAPVGAPAAAPMAAPAAAPAYAPPAAPAAPMAAPAVAPAYAPPAPPAAPAAPVRQMTAAANGVTYEAYKAAGWSDEALVSNGLMLPPAGIAPSFN